MDIGCGGGRTAFYLKLLTNDYRGIDYSDPMIRACKERFREAEAQFSVEDARDLSVFDKESFDFILFAYNGLDYISHKERIKA
ncbi:MAG: class I SAM-dependent methyltransferase, partial [Magnetococcales bacterium]|nr:class I SAM-dependent methyltransferase [Magnetococcales bacterium]